MGSQLATVSAVFVLLGVLRMAAIMQWPGFRGVSSCLFVFNSGLILYFKSIYDKKTQRQVK